MTHHAMKAVLAVLLSVTFLQGCAVVAVGAGTMAVVAANDRRTVGTQVDDQTAETRINFAMSEVEQLDEMANVNVVVYNAVALLTGQASDENLRRQAEQAARSVPYVRKVHNQIRINQPLPATTQANDIWLGSKVRTQLLADSDINSMQIKVTVQDSEVFLMGLVTTSEANRVVEKVRNIDGVARVVKAFEII